MTNAQVIWHPRTAEACDRINARAKAENISHDVERARSIIRKPRGYSDAELRCACGFFMTHGDGGTDYLLADKHLFAINAREKVARNRRAVAHYHFLDGYNPDRKRPADHGLASVLAVLVGAGWVAVVLGWVIQQGWM